MGSGGLHHFGAQFCLISFDFSDSFFPFVFWLKVGNGWGLCDVFRERVLFEVEFFSLLVSVG